MLDPKIEAVLGNDRVADWCDMTVVSVGEGASVVSMTLADRHLNGNDAAHGGVTYALADVAFALAVNSRGPAVSANASITYCSAARAGDTLVATASEVSLSRKLGTYEVVVRNPDGKTVALFQGLGYRKGE
jgi:acyl-CoA thioesterase